jgi:PAS domain S-box-containing protein
VRRLKALYIIALMMIGATVIINHLILHSSLAEQVRQDQITDLSRRQKSLAEEIFRNTITLQVMEAGEGRKARAESLEDLVRQWRRVQAGLQRGDQGLGLRGDLSKEVRNLFNVARPPFDAVLTGSLRLIHRLRETDAVLLGDPEGLAAVQMVMEQEPRFVAAKDAIISQLESEQSLRLSKLREREQLLAAVVLAMLVAQGLFVFRPATASIGKTFEKLAQTTTDLARSEATFRSSFEYATVGMCLTGLDGTITQINPAMTILLRTTREKIVGRNLLAFVDPDDQGVFSQALSDLSRGSSRVPETEFRLTPPSGHQVWTSAAAALVRDTNEKPLFSVWQFQNVTQRRVALEALRESNSRTNRILESIAEAFIAFDGEWRYTYINETAARWLDRPAEDLIGRRLWDVYPGLIGPYVHSIFQEAVGTMKPIQTEEYFEARDAWIEFRAYPGREGMSIFFREVTERHRNEEEIGRLNEQLRERTAELEAINAELEAFSYSVSHDLRAPLRSIAGFSRALEEDYGKKLQADGIDYLDRIRRASARMGQLIDDLLNLSRVTRAELHFEPVDLATMAREVIEDLRVSEPERSETVEVTLPMAALTFGDPRLLRIVMENFLSNAWKFSRGVERAKIEFGIISESGRPVYFIRDNGAGFDMVYAKKLFGPFQRLHSAHEFPGTGIGLATVHRIILRHGGKCWAEAAIGKGATFFFTIATTNIDNLKVVQSP